jgi:hypothetical protein
MVGSETEFHRQGETKKFHSRSTAPIVSIRLHFNMIKASLFSVGVITLVLSTGCIFSKKAQRPKESSAISADIEESFRKRWVDKRAAEIGAQGTAADAARTKAEAEFRDRYGYTRAGQK